MPKDLTPQKILNMILRHVKLIILIAALVTLIAYGYSSFFITPVYSASSLIMVQNYSEYYSTQPTTSYNNSYVNGRIDSGNISASSTIAANCVILFSNSPDMTALMSGASVNIEQVEEQNFIRFNASSANPQVAANVANQLAEQAPKTFASLYGKDKGRVDTITSATAPTAPVSPNINQNTLVGLVIGLILGVLLAFFLEIIDTTLKPGDDLSKLYGLPVFAEIVDFEKEG
ncbi:MAG: hypothetical protein IJ725_02330 [Ruminococcus sp.]|nr:hypothetical protein [Ruminococcus sp.]